MEKLERRENVIVVSPSTDWIVYGIQNVLTFCPHGGATADIRVGNVNFVALVVQKQFWSSKCRLD